MKQKLLTILLAILIAPIGLTAQEVYMESGKVILDMSDTGEGIGLPAGAVIATPKYVGKDTAPASGTLLFGAGDVTNLVTGSINATVYRKLEIAPRDMGTSGVLVASGTGDGMSWTNGFNRCKSLSYNGITANKWRLPTQRELTLIWIFKTAIDDLIGGSTTFIGNLYWTSNENDASNVWHVDFSTGVVWYNPKSYTSNRVRCVREITE